MVFIKTEALALYTETEALALYTEGEAYNCKPPLIPVQWVINEAPCRVISSGCLSILRLNDVNDALHTYSMHFIISHGFLYSYTSSTENVPIRFWLGYFFFVVSCFQDFIKKLNHLLY